MASQYLPVATAPKDGRLIYGYDGEQWRRVAWQPPILSPDEAAGWMHAGQFRIEVTLWMPIDALRPEILESVAAGNRGMPALLRPRG